MTIRSIDPVEEADKITRAKLTELLAEEGKIDGAIFLWIDATGTANFMRSHVTNAEAAYLLYFLQMKLFEAMKDG